MKLLSDRKYVPVKTEVVSTKVPVSNVVGCDNETLVDFVFKKSPQSVSFPIRRGFVESTCGHK